MLEMPHGVQWLTPTPRSRAVSNSARTLRKLFSALNNPGKLINLLKAQHGAFLTDNDIIWSHLTHER